MSALKILSNHEVIERTTEISKREKVITAKLLSYLAEMETRSLHLELGYSSLYSYLVGALKYSEPAAARRSTGAQLVQQYPQILGYLESGELHLSGLSIMKSALKSDAKPAALIEACRGKSKSEIERILILRQPERAQAPKKEKLTSYNWD